MHHISEKRLISSLIVVVFTMLLALSVSTIEPQAGLKDFSIEVVDDKGESNVYEIMGEAEYLRDAMDLADGLTYSGDESEYGLMVTVINGVEADYNKNGAYWAFYVNDEYCEYGVDSQVVSDGDAFRIEYTK